jgi:excisionase family DNA binding protein
VPKLLTNPVDAGADVFGRPASRVRIEASRKRVVRGVRQSPADWTVRIRDHRESCISGDRSARNQPTIADNGNMKGERVRGAVRRGEGLLAGLRRCRRCGRKRHVGYRGQGGNTARDRGVGARLNHGSCLAFGARRIDAAIGAEVLRALRPEGVAGARQVLEHRGEEVRAPRRQVELALEQARVDAARARRQDDAVDPDNRLVAGELERRGKGCLAEVARLEPVLASADTAPPVQLSAGERERLLALGGALERVWNHPAATPETRKQILRPRRQELLVDVEDATLAVVRRWQGSDHTPWRVKKNRSGQPRWGTDRDPQERSGELARRLPDARMAGRLNRLGKRTAQGLPGTESRIRSWRSDHGVRVYREGARRERGALDLHEAAEPLGVSKMTVWRWIRDRRLPARPPCHGARRGSSVARILRVWFRRMLGSWVGRSR